MQTDMATVSASANRRKELQLRERYSGSPCRRYPPTPFEGQQSPATWSTTCTQRRHTFPGRLLISARRLPQRGAPAQVCIDGLRTEPHEAIAFEPLAPVATRGPAVEAARQMGRTHALNYRAPGMRSSVGCPLLSRPSHVPRVSGAAGRSSPGCGATRWTSRWARRRALATAAKIRCPEVREPGVMGEKPPRRRRKRKSIWA